MSVHRRTAAITLARRMRNYAPGETVKIIRGEHAGKLMTIRENGADHVALLESPKRDIMSKGNVEPAQGFTDLEMKNAEIRSRAGD